MRIRNPIYGALALGLSFGTAAAAQDVKRVDLSQLARYWILLNQSVDADVPNGGRNMSAPGCAAVSFLIGTDGVPQNVKPEKSVPSPDFGDIAASAVKRFRYGPALTNRPAQPVATYYIVPFNAPASDTGQVRTMAPCRLSGYPAG